MTAQSGDFTSARSRYMTQQRRDDEAREERRIKALWFLYRNDHMDIVEMLGLVSRERFRKRNENG